MNRRTMILGTLGAVAGAALPAVKPQEITWTYTLRWNSQLRVWQLFNDEDGRHLCDIAGPDVVTVSSDGSISQ